MAKLLTKWNWFGDKATETARWPLVADQRIHGTTKRQVREVFERAEKPALLPMPEARFDLFHEALRSVHRDGHEEIKGAYYSVPPEFLGQRVWARWDVPPQFCRHAAEELQRPPHSAPAVAKLPGNLPDVHPSRYTIEFADNGPCLAFLRMGPIRIGIQSGARGRTYFPRRFPLPT